MLRWTSPSVPTGLRELLAELAAIPHCGVTRTEGAGLASVGGEGSLQRSLLGGPVGQELCPGPSQGKAGSFLFCLFSLSSERIDGDLKGYCKTNKCGGRQGCEACCLHEITRRKSMHLLQVGHRFASVLGGASDLGLLLEWPGVCHKNMNAWVSAREILV